MALVRRSVITVVGLLIVAGGIALMVLPGPGILLVLIVTSLVLVTTTILTLRNAGEEGLGLLS